MVQTSRIPLEGRQARSGCWPEDGLTDTPLGALAVVQASGTLAIGETHDGEPPPGWAHRSGTGAAAFISQAAWAFGAPNALPVLARRH